MKIKIIVTCLMILVASSLASENILEIMAEMEGVYEGSLFGKGIISLDFNGDGIDDLIVESKYNDYPGSFGRIYIYFGGDDFDNVPDMMVTGEHRHQYGKGLHDCGDINGDGYEDFASFGKLDECDDPMCYHAGYSFYYGGPDADLEADYLYDFWVSPDDYEYEDRLLHTIGDVDNDGYDDIPMVTTREWGNRMVCLMHGGNFEIETIYDYQSCASVHNFCRLGDINNDGQVDYAIGHCAHTGDGYDLPHITEFHLDVENDGFSNPFDFLYLTTQGRFFNGARGIGDYNNDGFDDYIYPSDLDITDIGFGLKLGGEDILNTDEFPLYGDWLRPNLIDAGVLQDHTGYGDFNNDGFSDVVGSKDEYGSERGIGGIWLGRENPNGICDLILESPDHTGGFGKEIVVGDFNNDGFDDIAFSAPYGGNNSWHGKVYVFAGNADLSDTTVGNDNSDVEQISSLEIMAYPNPFNPETRIRFGLPQQSNVKISIYNIKGQLIKNLCHENMEAGYHDIVWNGKNNDNKEVSSGIYFTRISTEKNTVNKKITLIK